MASYPHPAGPPPDPFYPPGYVGGRGGFGGRGRGRGVARDNNGQKLVKKMNESEAEKFVAKWLQDHRRIPLSFDGEKNSAGNIVDLRRYVALPELQKVAYQAARNVLGTGGRLSYTPGEGSQKNAVVSIALKITPNSNLGSALFEKYLVQSSRLAVDDQIVKTASAAFVETAKLPDATKIKETKET